jgi:RNA polymerase-binding transcription factor DksA
VNDGTSPVLPVRYAIENEFLFAPDGKPIWSIVSREEQSSLEGVAALHNSSMKMVEGTRARAFGSRNGTVSGIGKHGKEAARIYAHLTGRSWTTVDQPHQLMEGCRPAVVVGTYDSFDGELLNYLYQSSGQNSAKSAPGLIIGSNREELILQAKLRAAALFLQSQPSGSDVLTFAGSNMEIVATEERIILGALADSRVVCELLSARARLLWLRTHSDGIDAYLSENATLCPFAETTAVKTELPPRCIKTGFCHRQAMSVTQAQREGRLIPIHALEARLIVLDSCRTLRIRGGTADPKISLAAQICQHAKFGALICHWDTIISTASTATTLGNHVINGMPIGKAVARFNRSEAAISHGLLTCIVGDPDYTLPTEPARSRIPIASPSQGRKSAASGDADQKSQSTRFIQTIIERLQTRNKSPDPTYVANPRLKPSSEKSMATNVDDAMRRQILRDLAQTELLGIWLGEASVIESNRYGFCEHCRSPVVRLKARPNRSRMVREITSCPNCGITKDIPVGAEIEIEFETPRLTLKRFSPGPNCRAHFSIWSYKKLIYSSPWPTEHSGQLMTTCFIRRPLPTGPFVAIAFFAWDYELASVARELRADLQE